MVEFCSSGFCVKAEEICGPPDLTCYMWKKILLEISQDEQFSPLFTLFPQ
jgi:hypothetical protein